MAIATAASAAGSGTVTSVAFTPHGTTTHSFGTGATGTVAIVGTGFAADGGNVSITTNAPGVTFTNAAESDATDASADFASTSATVPGTYSITVTDDNGTETLASAFTVDAAPAVTAVSPAVLSDGNGMTTVTLTGSGFVTGATVTLTSDTNGTTLTVGAATVVSSTSITVPVTPTNSVTGHPATAGTYDVTVANTDGGNGTLASAFTITAYGITALSPSAVQAPNTGSSTTTVTINGAGFEYGATVALSGCGTIPTVGSATVSSATALTVPITVASGTANERCTVTVTNPTVGGNGASYATTGAFGVGEAGSLAPIITASSLTSGTAINAGDPGSVITFTGSGFSQYTVGGDTYDSTGAADTDSVVSNCNGNTGTSLTCEVTVSNDATSGSHTAALFNDGAEGDFANAFTVAGPAITSVSPSALAVGAPVGTVVTVTGTGFTNTVQGYTDCNVGCDLDGVFQYVSATTVDYVVTESPGAGDPAAGDYIVLYSVDANGDTVYTPEFDLTVHAAPTVSALAYGTAGTTGVGVGATAQKITLTGTGLETGATVGSFVNGNGTADPSVTATVTSVNSAGTQLVATIAIAAGDVNPADGYTVTNPDGGVVKVSAIQTDALVIDAGPTVTAVTPSPALPSATTAFTITGTGFKSGASVTTTPANGICGVATVTSSTSISVSCSLGVEGLTPTALAVTNPDGGTATSSAVLPAATPAPPKPAFHVTAVHGSAVAGKTVTLTITGTGFYGQPKISSTAAGTKAVVSHSTSTALTVFVTTKAGVSGEHTFTVTLANGKSGKVNYSVKK